EVDGESTLNSNLDVLNQSDVQLTGSLTVEQQTTVNNGLAVLNNSGTSLSGILEVTDATKLENTLQVTGASNTDLSGNLEVFEETFLNELSVVNAAKTAFTGTLNVAGESNFNNAITINGLSTIDNDLTVTGTTSLTSLSSGGITVSGDNVNTLATFFNTNDALGGGISIKLGRNHGRWTGSSILTIDQTLVSNDPDNNVPPTDPIYVAALTTIKTQFANPGPLSVNEIIALAPTAMRIGAIGNINNLVFQEIQAQLNFPKNLPSVTLPALTVPGFETERVFFNGLDPICSGQVCFSVCFPFAGCYTVCIPPVNVCVPTIPKIAFPALSVPTTSIRPTIGSFVPALPTLSEAGLPNVSIPDFPDVPFTNSLSKQNEYFAFYDVADRKTGSVRAQSITDFLDNTIFNDVYAINVASEFIGVDLLKALVKGGAATVKLIGEFNKLGVQYSSGNGDYAEWLPRVNPDEYITAGDIVAVKGGKISKNLEGVEQIMVVSFRPIVLGNAPQPEETHLGNNVAFIGQVPAKVMGPVRTGDYIVASGTLPGYGVAVSKENMTVKDSRLAVGRSWETNLNEGPKVVNTVVGLQNGDFKNQLNDLQKEQQQLDEDISDLERKLQQIEEKIINGTKKDVNYASKD
ncbi:MAG: hypothetical protein AAFP76_12660, partial [Bacteroidota bacterium]